MRIVRVFAVVLFATMLCACACSKKRGGGFDGGTGDDNIPGPEAGSELKDINFGFDSSALSETSKNTLRASARWLMDNPSTKTSIEGHCDERGTSEYNMALGQRRSDAARSFLTSLGIARGRIRSVSFGKSQANANATTEDEWQKDRHDHFVFK